MRRKIYCLLACCVVALCVFAKPARRGAMKLTQPDGTQITAYLHGDAFFHYYTTADGQMLERDAAGFYQPTHMPSEEELQTRHMSNPRRVAMQQKVGTLNLAPRGLVILVNFSDLTFQTSYEEMENMLNGQNYSRSYTYKDEGRTRWISSSGSARQYFQDNSCGQYNPVFDVVGPVTVSRGYAYYGQNDSQGDDKHPDQMIKEACELVNNEVDFSLYDNDGDGQVDFVYVIYAGYGEADGAGENYIWPHNYRLTYTGVNCIVDGKRVDNYACSNELDYYSKQHDGIGTFCHEFSHVLGLPDLYATTENATHKTMGAWDILDYGPYNNDGNTPPAYSAYERFYMGWLHPTLINSACDVEVPALCAANSAVLMTRTGEHNMTGTNPNPKEFYLLENRQKDGWDQYLPGHGLLVTKINYDESKWSNNKVNASQYVMGVDIVEADGKKPAYSQSNRENGYFGKPGDTYPTGADSFTELTSYPVTAIREENGKICFQVSGGGENINLDVQDTKQNTSAKKVFREGRILIEYNGDYYDLLGRSLH